MIAIFQRKVSLLRFLPRWLNTDKYWRIDTVFKKGWITYHIYMVGKLKERWFN